MRVIYRKIRHARYLYIKRNVDKVWVARYTLGAHYQTKNTVLQITSGRSMTVNANFLYKTGPLQLKNLRLQT
jgi:hypothetical protein